MECCVHVCLVKCVTFLTRQCHYDTVHSSLHVIIPPTQDSATPLYIASEKGHRAIVNILIRNGADINLARNV